MAAVNKAELRTGADLGTPRVGPHGRDRRRGLASGIVADGASRIRTYGETGSCTSDYVIRSVEISSDGANGVTTPSGGRLSPSGRARGVAGAMVQPGPLSGWTVVCVRDPELKQAWCPGASQPEATDQGSDRLLRQSVGYRVGLRDSKDLRFGMGSGSVHVRTRQATRSAVAESTGSRSSC